MRAISLHQPHAAFVQFGLKPYETRHWSTSCRGPLLIHAAARKMDIHDHFLAAIIFTPLAGRVEWWEVFPISYGAFVCLADLSACLPSEEITPCRIPPSNDLGDFSPGRFAWELRDVRRFENPLPAIGRQRFWDYPIGQIKSAMIPSPWIAL